MRTKDEMKNVFIILKKLYISQNLISCTGFPGRNEVVRSSYYIYGHKISMIRVSCNFYSKNITSTKRETVFSM